MNICLLKIKADFGYVHADGHCVILVIAAKSSFPHFLTSSVFSHFLCLAIDLKLCVRFFTAMHHAEFQKHHISGIDVKI